MTEDTQVKSNHFTASEDAPKVRVRSGKTGKEVGRPLVGGAWRRAWRGAGWCRHPPARGPGPLLACWVPAGHGSYQGMAHSQAGGGMLHWRSAACSGDHRTGPNPSAECPISLALQAVHKPSSVKKLDEPEVGEEDEEEEDEEEEDEDYQEAQN